MSSNRECTYSNSYIQFNRTQFKHKNSGKTLTFIGLESFPITFPSKYSIAIAADDAFANLTKQMPLFSLVTLSLTIRTSSTVPYTEKASLTSSEVKLRPQTTKTRENGGLSMSTPPENDPLEF